MWHILPFYVNFPEGARTGSWIGNQDPVRGDGIVVVKIYRIPPESLACSVPDRSFD